MKRWIHAKTEQKKETSKKSVDANKVSRGRDAVSRFIQKYPRAYEVLGR